MKLSKPEGEIKNLKDLIYALVFDLIAGQAYFECKQLMKMVFWGQTYFCNLFVYRHIIYPYIFGLHHLSTPSLLLMSDIKSASYQDGYESIV